MKESLVEVPPDEGVLHLNEPWPVDVDSNSNNSNILYIAVEYVKENSYMLQSDPASLSPQTAAYHPEFDQHVSPLDPNMSSVAPYSPVYTSESSVAYNDPVVVTQIVANDPENQDRTLNDVQIDHRLQRDVTNQYLQMVKEEQRLVNDTSAVEGLQMVPDGEHGVDILITDQSTGISYLVERCLADNSQLLDPLLETELDPDLLALDDNDLKSQLPEIKIEAVLLEHNEELKRDGNQNSKTDLGPDLLALDDNGLKSQLPEIKIERVLLEHNEELKGDRNKNGKLKCGRRSQRQMLSNSGPETEEQLLSCVQQICDKPILSRARASLPESYLFIGKNSNEDNSVFAKKFIPKRTQFGPIDGILITDNVVLKLNSNEIDLSIEIDGTLRRLDVSDENSANWMCFVRLASIYSKQNLVLTQQDNNLYFTTTKNIHPKQELLVGYGMNYAQRRNLLVLEPMIEEEDMWPCYECSEKFTTSELLQKHLDDHDTSSANQASRKKRKHSNNAQAEKSESLQCTVCLDVFSSHKFGSLRQHLVDHGIDPEEPLQNRFIIARSYNCDDDLLETNVNNVQEPNVVEVGEPIPYTPIKDEKERPKMEYKCPVCYKVFASGDRIQRHMMVHGAEESKPLQCDKCNKRFLNNSALACHLKTHPLGRKVFECPICRESFHHVLQLKVHVPKHCVDGLYTCPHCCKVFEKYSIIRKHIRAFHCERKHMCPDCSKPFPTLDKLRMHLLKHSDHREFLCADCGKQFKRKDKLKEHCKRMHSEERENAMPRDKGSSSPSKKFTPKVQPTDYHRFIYKCHSCLVGFKRRGMLVNHLAKRHPDISPDSVPELNLPILRATKDYYCNYCDKVYKSSSKRKAHILKNHPGAALPLSNRRLDSAKATDLPNPTFSQTVGSITTHPQACQWCHKQYASKAKLLQHQRKKHTDMLQPEKSEEEKLNEEDLIGDIVQQEVHYYQLVSMDDAQFGATELGGDSRLLTTGNNMVPPR